MDPKLREMFNEVTKGPLLGNTDEPATEDWKINGQYVDETDEKNVTIDGVTYLDGVVGIPFLEDAAKHPDQPFFISIKFMKAHQPNLPAPEYEHKSQSRSKYADSVVELDARVGNYKALYNIRGDDGMEGDRWACGGFQPRLGGCR